MSIQLFIKNLVNAGLGNGEVGKLVGGLGAWSGNLPVVKNITKAMGNSNNQKLMGILTKAKLESQVCSKPHEKIWLRPHQFQ